MSAFHHISVLRHEVYQYLCSHKPQCLVDCTMGGGGHSAYILENQPQLNHIIGIDRDPDAINHLKQKFSAELQSGQLSLTQATFSQISDVIAQNSCNQKVDAIIADIGVSSHQIDTASRGFSFQADGPLDMRMSPELKVTAADMVNTYSAQELQSIFKDLGDEPKAFYLAKAIVKRREQQLFTRTAELAEFVKQNLHYKTVSKKHPATRAFQGLRIAVNQELDELKQLITSGFECLAPGGRFGIISFHSCEDRIIKHMFKNLCKRPDLPKGLPITTQELQERMPIKAKIIKPFPVLPTSEEIMMNPRARSAKLRVIEKLSL